MEEKKRRGERFVSKLMDEQREKLGMLIPGIIIGYYSIILAKTYQGLRSEEVTKNPEVGRLAGWLVPSCGEHSSTEHYSAPPSMKLSFPSWFPENLENNTH